MFVRLLSSIDKAMLVACAELLSVSDDPLLWDGKAKGDITSSTDLTLLSFKRDSLEVAWISELKNEKALDDHARSSALKIVADSSMVGWISELKNEKALYDNAQFSAFNFLADSSTVASVLLEKLKKYSLMNVESPEVRLQAATVVLKGILEKQAIVNPSVVKLMLFELISLALRDGCISNIEWGVLKEFQRYYQLEDFIFDDLLERAEAVNQEVTKTIAIILE